MEDHIAEVENYHLKINSTIKELGAIANNLISEYNLLDLTKLKDKKLKRYEKFLNLANAINRSDDAFTTIKIINNLKKYINDSKFALKKTDNEFDIKIEYFGTIIEDITSVIADTTLRLVSKILLKAASEFREKCILNGYLTFSDAILGSKYILQTESNSFDIWQKYDCVIVDEFQDTDPNQLEIIKILGSNQSLGDLGRLFVVGDHKQSIYGFRGVEINKYKTFIEQFELENLTLDTSRRTTKHIIDNVNSIMSGLIEGYDVMASVRENFSKESIPHFSTIGQGMNSSVGDLRKVQAKDVATKISDLLNIAIFNKDIDGFVASQYKDITILIRDRSILKDLVDELKSQSIPFNVDSPTLIFEHRFTQMINSILGAIAMPKESINVIGALRSPLFKCSNNDLLLYTHFIQKHMESDSYIDNIWCSESISSINFENADFDVQKVKHALDEIETLHKVSSKQELPTFISNLMFKYGLALSIASAKNETEDTISDISKILILKSISFSNNSSSPTLFNFVEQLNREKESSKASEKISLDSNENVVHILTTHSSKGLEFPIVIYIPSIKSEKTNTRSQAVYLPIEENDNFGEDFALYLNKNFRDTRLKDFKEDKFLDEIDEEKRISYVAMTRARDYLIVCQHHQVNKDSKPRVSNASKLYLKIEENKVQYDSTDSQFEITSFKNPEIKPTISPIVARFPISTIKMNKSISRLNIKIETNRTLSPGSTINEDTKKTYNNDKPKNLTLGPAIGRAVHRALNLLSFNAAQDTIIEICRNCSYQEGILEHSINVQKCVTTALNTNVIKNLKNNYLREVPIAGILGNNKYSGYIDLLVKNTDHYLIVDYKTDTIDSKNTIDKKNEIYSNQLAIYSALLKKLFKQ